MTFQEIYTEVLDYFPKAALEPTKAKEFVNRAYRQMAMSFQFVELEEETDADTVVDQATVTWPTGARDIITVYNETEKERLEPETIQFYDDQDTSTDNTGAPKYFILYGGELFIFPTADAVYTLRIRHRGLPDEMDDDAESPVYPSDWHEVIVLNAASKAGFFLGYDSKGINLKNEALGLIASLQEDATMASRRRIGQISVQRTRRPAKVIGRSHAEFD